MLNPFTKRKILKNGKPGRGRVISMSVPDSSASSQNVAMTLQVYVEGLAPYEVEDQWMVSGKDPIGMGIELPVKVDQDNPQKVAIDWEVAREESDAATTARREALAAQGPVGGAPAAAAGGAGGVRDPLAGSAAALSAGAAAGIPGLGGLMDQVRQMQQAAMTMQAGAGGVPVVDTRNDPELRAKIEQVLGHPIETGKPEALDFSKDPQKAAQVMQIVQQHQLEKMGMGGAGGGSAAMGAAAMGAMGAGAMPGAAQPTAGDDALSKLERLNKLREDGALTQAEFDAEKRELLGEI